MKLFLSTFLLLFPLVAISQVITCGDVLSVTGEAKAVLHDTAQQRAQEKVEDFTSRTLTKPYIVALEPTCFHKKCKMTGTAETTAEIVETFWCETESTPLHSAYYSLYTSGKDFFDKKYLP